MLEDTAPVPAAMDNALVIVPKSQHERFVGAHNWSVDHTLAFVSMS